MTLPPAAPQRQLKHRRQIDVQVYARGNGLWEVDALLTDVKTRVAHLAGGDRAPGVPLHEMLLRLVVNERLDIVEAGSETRWMPYTCHCNDHGDAYTTGANRRPSRSGATCTRTRSDSWCRERSAAPRPAWLSTAGC